MTTVLSTKRLSPVQKKHLLLANIGLVDYDAVHIKDVNINLDSNYFENAIFTSQNAVRIVKTKQLNINNAFCVGKNTANALRELTENIIEVAEHAKQLSSLIIKKYPDKSFDFFCSKQRRNELPSALLEQGVMLKEHYVYESFINPQLFKNQFDAILCFSPLGVKAYYENHDYRPPAICIGPTTTKTAKHYTSTYTATYTNIESVIVKAVKVLKA